MESRHGCCSVQVQRIVIRIYEIWAHKPCIQVLHTSHARQGFLHGRPAAILGGPGCRAVGVEHEGVECCRYRTVLPQAEHVLALVELLVIQDQQSLCMHPAAQGGPSHDEDAVGDELEHCQMQVQHERILEYPCLAQDTQRSKLSFASMLKSPVPCGSRQYLLAWIIIYCRLPKVGGLSLRSRAWRGVATGLHATVD